MTTTPDPPAVLWVDPVPQTGRAGYGAYDIPGLDRHDVLVRYDLHVPGSAVIPVETLRLAAQAVEAFAVSPYGDAGLAALASVLDAILRAARGGAS